MNGHYQYVINKNLGSQGEVRSLYRLDPTLFTHGRTQCRDDVLPPISDIQSGLNIQDETWQKRDGSYITKYDFSCFARGQEYHGVHGQGLGAWIIAPGMDYYIGDQMKQELMVHRETKTNDAVMLHYYHGEFGCDLCNAELPMLTAGTHYMSDYTNDIPQGKMWGPWLFYINDGNQGDATGRSTYEDTQWPYSWVNDTKFQNRGTVKGQLVLSDGRQASGAAVFLGDENGWETDNQGTYYQYTTYANTDGSFEFDNVRLEKNYRLIAWANGGALSDVDGVHNGTMVGLNGSSIDLGKITWNRPSRDIAWRIGDFDKTTKGFKLGGSPYQHGLSDYTPANLVYSIGTNKTSDWYFAQSAQGNWSVIFDAATAAKANRSATLTLSMAGFTSRSGFNLSDPTVTGLNISMNSVQFASFGPERSSDKSLYRSATTAGAYYQRQFQVPAQLLLSNRFNRLDL